MHLLLVHMCIVIFKIRIDLKTNIKLLLTTTCLWILENIHITSLQNLTNNKHVDFFLTSLQTRIHIPCLYILMDTEIKVFHLQNHDTPHMTPCMTITSTNQLSMIFFSNRVLSILIFYLHQSFKSLFSLKERCIL